MIVKSTIHETDGTRTVTLSHPQLSGVLTLPASTAAHGQAVTVTIAEITSENTTQPEGEAAPAPVAV